MTWAHRKMQKQGSPRTRVLGIDPGIRGGLALLDNGQLVTATEIPVSGEKAKQRVNAAELYRWLYHHDVDCAFIERAQAMPRQGSSSGFLYGRAVGAIEAVVLVAEIPLTIVEPTTWKKHFGLKGGDKENARQKALLLLPQAHAFMPLKKHHGLAEAALLALYGSR